MAVMTVGRSAVSCSPEKGAEDLRDSRDKWEIRTGIQLRIRTWQLRNYLCTVNYGNQQ